MRSLSAHRSVNRDDHAVLAAVKAQPIGVSITLTPERDRVIIATSTASGFMP
jgi:hypothetical protein